MKTALIQARLVLRGQYLPARDGVKYVMPELNTVHENSNASPFLQEGERFLQVLWNEGCGASALQTRDGAPIQLHSAGTWNPAGGPDFTRASLTINGRRHWGDIEIHRREADWFAHGHHRDPAYRNVCLHVVGVPSSLPAHCDNGRVPPCLVLADCVGETIRQATLQAADAYPYARQVPPGRCALQCMNWDDKALQTWLEAAGLSRFREKTRRLLHSVEERGREQGLYQHLFDALGYRANRHPFQELARSIPLPRLKKTGSAEGCAALLFGAAGLLPDPSAPALSARQRRTLRHLWDCWWQCGSSPMRSDWTWSGVRPSNRPDRRLAAGVSLLYSNGFAPASRLLAAARFCDDAQDLIRCLEDRLTVQPGDCAPWLPALAPKAGAERLLGRARIHDIVTNVALPYLAAEAVREDDPDLLRIVETAFLELPKLQSNRFLQEVKHRLFLPPSRAGRVVRKACHQQGLLAIHRDFCLALGTDCLRCPLANQLGEPANPPPAAPKDRPDFRLPNHKK